MPTERQSNGGGLGAGGGHPTFLGSNRSALLALQQAANSNASAMGGGSRGQMAQIVAMHQPGHPAMYFLHPSAAHAIAAAPYFTTSAGRPGQPVTLTTADGTAIPATVQQQQQQSSPNSSRGTTGFVTTTNSTNAYMPRGWQNIAMQQVAAAVAAEQQARAPATHSNNSNSAPRSGTTQTEKDNSEAGGFNNTSSSNQSNSLTSQKNSNAAAAASSSRKPATKYSFEVSKKRKATDLSSSISIPSTSRSPLTNSLHGKNTKKPVPDLRSIPSANSQQQGKERKVNATSNKYARTADARKKSPVTKPQPEVVCIDLDDDDTDEDEVDRNRIIERSKEQPSMVPTQRSPFLNGVGSSTDYSNNNNFVNTANKMQLKQIPIVAQRQVVAHPLQSIQTNKGREIVLLPQQQVLEPPPHAVGQNQAEIMSRIIRFKSSQEREEYVKSLRDGAGKDTVNINPQPPFISIADSASLNGNNGMNGVGESTSGEDSDGDFDSSILTGFAIPDPDVDYPLAGPFVQGLITGNQEILNSLDSGDEISKNQMVSRLLLSVNQINEAEANPSVTFPLCEIETIAESLVAERRISIREAVRVAFIEMKRRHDKIFQKYRRQLAKVLHHQTKELKQPETKANDEARVLSTNLSIVKDGHQREIEAMKARYEETISNLSKSHDEKISQLENELKQKDLERQKTVESFKKVSTQAFRLWRQDPT